jgi:hypothetical protein
MLTASVINSSQYISWFTKKYCLQHYLLNKNVEDVAPPTVKIARVGNDTLISN